jgi:hypothetical protein
MLTNVNTIKMRQYQAALDFTIKNKRNLIVLGMAGIGKTEAALDRILQTPDHVPVYINLSVLEYPDLVGLQTISQEGHKKWVDYAAPKFLPLKDYKSDNKKRVIVFDELDKAKPELQNPLLELLQFHTVNGSPVDVEAFVLTGNLPDEGAFSMPISHALTNRCMVYKLEHDFNAWLDWAVSTKINPLITGFLSRNREMLAKPAVEGDPTAYCRESPRSWSQAARDLDSAKTEDVDFQTLLVSGRVGLNAAIKFKVWLEHYHVCGEIIDEIVKTGLSKEFPQLSFDKQMITAIGIVNETVKKFGTPEQDQAIKNVYPFLDTLPSEVQMLALRSSLNSKVIIENNLMEHPVLMPYLERIISMMNIV